MVKEAPSIGRMIAMVVFTLSVFGLLMFLWLAFGGPIPPKPESYRFKVRVQEAPLLGETYVQLPPGHREKGTLGDGQTLPNTQVEPTVELDEIFDAFDPKTRA